MEPEKPSLPGQNSLKNENRGCSGAAAMILISIWIIVASFIAQIINWSLVQTIFEGSFKVPDLRWLILVIYAVLLLIPLSIAVKISKNPDYRARFKGLAIISLLSLLLSISRLLKITNWQGVVAIQIGLTLLFLFSLWLIKRKSILKAEAGEHSILEMFLFAAAFGGLLGLPWVLWGSQGSELDTILGVIAASLFGFLIATTLINQGSSTTQENNQSKNMKGLAGIGWAITLGLLILTTAVDQNGNGWVLVAAIFPLGFACASLAMNMDGTISTSGRVAAGILITFGFAWPMIMVDPDELSLVTSSGTGELLEYVTKGALLAFGLALLAMLVLLLIRKWIHTSNKIGIFGAILFLFSWLGIFIIYGFNGHPGFYGEKYFVILKAQTDLSRESTITDPSLRRAAVYQSLVKTAATSQLNLRSWLDSKGITYKPYYLVNAIEIDADPLLRAQLENRSDIDRILDSPILRPLANKVPVSKGFDTQPNGDRWNLSSIGAEAVHSDLKVFGEGIVVGQSDSGVQGDHPELAAQYRGSIEGSNNYNWFDPWNGSISPVDIGGHGTHTLGSIVGKNVGVAPKSEWIGCVNLARNLGNPAFYLDCMQFMLAPFPQGADPTLDGKPEKGANVLNNSWGCPEVEGCDPAVYLPAVKALKDAGVFVVASAGNSGYDRCSSIEDPLAIYQDVYTVGAIDKTGNLATFSSLGPVTVDGSGRIKPDIVAPGVDIFSSFPGSTYEQNSGTSMAGPHVVGVVALMWSANPNLIGDIDRTREILNQTADPYKGEMPVCAQTNNKPNNAAGYGVVNAYKAVQQALEDKKNSK